VTTTHEAGEFEKYLIEIRIRMPGNDMHDIIIEEANAVQPLNNILNRFGGRYLGYLAGADFFTYWCISPLDADSIRLIKNSPISGKIYRMMEV